MTDSPSGQPLTAFSSSPRGGAVGKCIHPNWHISWCCHCAGLVQGTMLLRFRGLSSLSSVEDTVSLQVSWSSHSCGLLPPQPYVQRWWWRGMNSGPHSQLFCFDQLWISVTISAEKWSTLMEDEIHCILNTYRSVYPVRFQYAYTVQWLNKVIHMYFILNAYYFLVETSEVPTCYC